MLRSKVHSCILYHSYTKCWPTEYVQRFATKAAADASTEDKDDDEEEAEMSDIGSLSDDD